MKKQTVTLEQLGAFWGMTPRRVSQLLTEMDFEYTKGAVDAAAATRAYIGWLRRDESSKRAQREHLSWKIQRMEEKAYQEDGQYLRPEEIQKVIDRAWEKLWEAHSACLTHLYHAANLKMSQDEAHKVASAAELLVKGALIGVRDHLQKLGKQQLEDMNCELRKGMFRCDRRIRALEHALGERGP